MDEKEEEEQAGGARGKEKEEEGKAGEEGEERGAVGAETQGAVPGAQASEGAQREPWASIAPRAARKWRVWPGATGPAPPARPSPAVATACPQTSRTGQGPGRRAGEGQRRGGLGKGRPRAPGSAPASAASQPSFFPSPAPPAPGRRGGKQLSPLCNRGVKKCEKRALCYLFGSRKFMPS